MKGGVHEAILLVFYHFFALYLAALPDLPEVRPLSWRRADLLIKEVMREHNIVMQLTWDGAIL